MTICNSSEKGFTGIIYGYRGSTAQEYAEKCGYQFREIDSDEDLVTTVPSSSVTTTTTTAITKPRTTTTT